MERSGLLREPVAGRIDFVHRTFQEYLAAKAAVDGDEVGLLVANAHDDQWREVVVMAAGHAPPDQCAELLRGLIKRGRRRTHSSRLNALAVACAQAAHRLDPQLHSEIERLAGQLVPPATNEAAESLADAGEMLLDLLRAKPPLNKAEAAASIRAASRIGGQAATQLIGDILAQHAEPSRSLVDDEVVNAWRLFKPDLYVRDVLARSWPPEKELQVPDPASMEALSFFPALRAARCNLRPQATGTSSINLSALAGNKELRRLALDGCDEYLDLSPLLQLQSLGAPRSDSSPPPAATGCPERLLE